VFRGSALAVALAAVSMAMPLIAADVGKATGTATVDATTTLLEFAVQTRKENLFDDKKQDTVVVLTDKPLGTTKPDDEAGLSLRARRGELVVFALRIDGSKLVNVTVSHKGVNGLVILPGQWFQYSATKPGTGTLKLAKRDNDGHSYAVAVDFAAAPYVAPRQTAAPAAPPQPVAAAPAKAPAPAPATTSNIDRKAATPLLIQALMQKDEHQALEIIKLGVDPNGRDQYGVPLLNWAVMTCQPQVVKALIDAKADLKYERAPGMTILTEAGACPEAAKILRAAGAR
jgi:hypothetical protein